MKKKFKIYYRDVAVRTAELSTATRLKVGAIAVKNNRIISIGYNGTPSGWINKCETRIYLDDDDEFDFDFHGDVSSRYPYSTEINGVRKLYRLVTKTCVLHAEHNAISKLANSKESAKGAVMFCTVSPCMECAKLIHNTGIKKLYYIDEYRSNEGINFLLQCGIKVEKLP